ncbi:hypothetical protein BDV18DRAFT_159087 [Aspergillus unguis]
MAPLAFRPSFPVFVLLPLGASAWTFLWRNESTTSSVEDGQSAQNCTQVWHQEDEGFSWDPEGPWCIKLYSDAICAHSNGISCEGYLWRQVASQNISAFSVYPMPPASVTAFGFASSSSTPTPTPTPTTTSTDSGTDNTPTAEPVSSKDGGLSHGAIAGIVVGAVAALALLCAAFFFLGRRTARKIAAAAAAAAAKASDAPRSDSSAVPASSNTNPSSPPSENLSSSPTLRGSAPMPRIAELPKPATVVEREDHGQPPNGTAVIELPGPIPGGELSNSREVQEMAGTCQIQELEGGETRKCGQ